MQKSIRIAEIGLPTEVTGESTFMFTLYSVSKKSSPLNFFAVLSLLVNLCNWKLPWLLPKHKNSYVYTDFGPFIWIFVWNV